MRKPSIFSNNYQQQMKRRNINKILFILLILCIAFFGGKYYLNKNNIQPFKGLSKINVFSKMKISSLWTKKHNNQKDDNKPGKTNKVVQDNKSNVDNKKPHAVAIVPSATSGSAITTTSAIAMYTYNGKDNNKYNVSYQKDANGKVSFTGINDITNTSEFGISKDKSMIVFDIKSSNSIIICDSTGKFTDITRKSYTTRSTGMVIPKESAITWHKGYIWAEKPYFTDDGRIVYLSRLPFIRNDETLYLWSENINGTDYKNLYRVGKDKNAIIYLGYDSKGRLMIKIYGKIMYLNKGSNFLSGK